MHMKFNIIYLKIFIIIMKRIIFVRHGESTENVANKDGKSYDKNKIVLTDNGKKQATITGDYLYEVFGKFDKVYSSPVVRCQQTANIICNQTKYKNKINIEELLVELGYEFNKFDGLSKEEVQKVYNSTKLNLPKDKLFSGIKNWDQFQKKLSETKNPFDRLKFTQLYPEFQKTSELSVKPDADKVKSNLKKFLKKIKNTKDINILVITHGGCIVLLQHMLCNLDIMNENINLGEKGNCCIVCVGLENGKYSLISARSIKHLEEKI